MRTYFLALVAFAAMVSACNKPSTSTPVTPSGTIRVDALTPATPAVNAAPQTVVVTGDGFAGPLQVVFVDPQGNRSRVEAQVMLPTRLTASVTLPVAGNYRMTIEEQGGVSSLPFSVTVVASESVMPVLTAVTPSSANRGASPQFVGLTGTSLTDTQTVQITAPDGQTTVLSAGQFTVTSDTSISMTTVLEKIGLYLVAASTTKGLSNTVTITVN